MVKRKSLDTGNYFCYHVRMTLRERLQQARQTAGLSKSGLALRAGLTKNALYNMDEPDWNPSYETIARIETVLGLNEEQRETG